MACSPTGTPPRRRGLRIAVVIWGVVTLALMALAGAQLAGYLSLPEDQHVPVSGGTVTITEPGDHGVYYETGTGSYGELQTVLGPDGAPVPADEPSGSETYSINERHGVLLASITAPTAGTYTLTGNSDGSTGSDELVLSSRSIGALFGVIASGGAAVFVLVAGGLTLLVTGLATRRRPGPPAGGRPGRPPVPGGPGYLGSAYPGPPQNPRAPGFGPEGGPAWGQGPRR